MIDFAAVHYLGWHHPSGSLPAWEQFSTGLPAVLGEHPAAPVAAARLARLQGCQQAVLAPASLHLFWDVFGGEAQQALFGSRPVIYLDAGVYPIARWGAERAAFHGAQVRVFPHHDPDALRALLRSKPARQRAVVVCDGISACCGQPAPLRAYLQALPLDGVLVVDDTQALGLLGAQPGPRQPYGAGGGGSLRWHALEDERILLVGSLAKGFGVPLAALSGSRANIDAFRRTSQTRLHCSPPSVPALLAAAHAIDLNALRGDRIRRRLASLVQFFRSQLAAWGLAVQTGLFPVQSVHLAPGAPVERLQVRLRQAGLRAVPRLCQEHGSPCLSFVISARHTPDELAFGARTLAAILKESHSQPVVPAPGAVGPG